MDDRAVLVDVDSPETLRALGTQASVAMPVSDVDSPRTSRIHGE